MVLFDSSATRSFLFLSLSKIFSDTLGKLDNTLEVYIAYDHPVWVPRVHQGFILELFSERYPIDLVHFPLHESSVIVGMDCLRTNGVMIDYDLQLFQVITLSGGELVIQGEGA